MDTVAPDTPEFFVPVALTPAAATVFPPVLTTAALAETFVPDLAADAPAPEDELLVGASDVTFATGLGGGKAPTPRLPPWNCGLAQFLTVSVSGPWPVMYPMAFAMNWLSWTGSGE